MSQLSQLSQLSGPDVASEVAVWATEPVHTHSTMSPAAIVMLCGLKAKSSTLTVCTALPPVLAVRLVIAQGIVQLVVVRLAVAVQAPSSRSVTWISCGCPSPAIGICTMVVPVPL